MAQRAPKPRDLGNSPNRLGNRPLGPKIYGPIGSEKCPVPDVVTSPTSPWSFGTLRTTGEFGLPPETFGPSLRTFLCLWPFIVDFFVPLALQCGLFYALGPSVWTFYAFPAMPLAQARGVPLP